MELKEVLLYNSSKSEMKYNEQRYHNKNMQVMIYTLLSALPRFLSTLFQKSRTPTFEEIFGNDNKNKKQDLLEERYNRKKKKRGG